MATEILKVVAHSEAETDKFIDSCLQHVSFGSVILLRGAMGAGKTYFVTHLAQKLLGDDIHGQSPTFTVNNCYIKGDQRIYHIDLYRLKTWDEFVRLGVLDDESSEKSLFCIEWSDVFDQDQWENFFLASSLKVFTLSIDILGPSERCWVLGRRRV